MDGSSFVAAVERLRRVVRPDGEWQSTARQLLRTLAHCPEGVTDAIVRCELQQHRKRGSNEVGGRMFTSVEELLRIRHSPPDMLLELRVLTIESDVLTLGQNADASEDVGAACLIHFPDERLLACLRGIRHPRVVPGTVLRIARGKTAEHALATRRSSKCNSLLLLPTPHVVLVLQPHLRAEDGVALGSALRDACDCVRGEPTLPSSGSLVLRAVRTTDVEHFDGRLLRRVLLERVDLEKLRTAWDISSEGGAATAAPPAASEVEAELVFWDAEQELARFIPDGCLTLIDQPALYTTGSAEPGGAPAQIGYGAHTVITVVDEIADPISRATYPTTEAVVGRLISSPTFLPANHGGGVLGLELHGKTLGGAETHLRIILESPTLHSVPLRLRSMAEGHHVFVSDLTYTAAMEHSMCETVFRGSCGVNDDLDCLHNLSCLPAVLRSPQYVSRRPLSDALHCRCDALVCIAAAVAWKESDHSRLILVLTLDDGQVAMHCSAHLQVVSELLNVNIEDFSHLSTPKRDEVLDGLLVYDRVWALTSGQKREWRVDCGVADLEPYTE